MHLESTQTVFQYIWAWRNFPSCILTLDLAGLIYVSVTSVPLNQLWSVQCLITVYRAAQLAMTPTCCPQGYTEDRTSTTPHYLEIQLTSFNCRWELTNHELICGYNHHPVVRGLLISWTFYLTSYTWTLYLGITFQLLNCCIKPLC